MELFTMNRQYASETPIDFFSSVIWTERVAGDGDFQLSAPATKDIISLLSAGVFVGCDESDVPMMIDDQTIQNNVLTVTGRSLAQNLNCRFVRFTAAQNDKSYPLAGSPGYIIQYLVQQMAIDGNWLNGVFDMGIPNPQQLKIPYLSIADYDTSLPTISMAVPYGPLYDVLKTIADTYQLGMRLRRVGTNDIEFRNYLGVDHTSSSTNELVRFSTQLDNFGNTKEVVSVKNFKTHAWVFPSGVTGTQVSGSAWPAGEDNVVGSYSGFDLRAEQVFADDITTTPIDIASILSQRAASALAANRMIGAVDGQIAPSSEYIYGTHYNLGNIVEVQGTSGIIQASRVTEYIRAQDVSGKKEYPTLVAVT